MKTAAAKLQHFRVFLSCFLSKSVSQFQLETSSCSAREYWLPSVCMRVFCFYLKSIMFSVWENSKTIISRKKSFCEKNRKKFVRSSLKAAMKFETKTSAIKWNNRKHIKLRESLTLLSSTFDFSSCAPHFHSQALLNTQKNQQKLNASAFARGNRVVVEMGEEETSLKQGNSQAEKKGY